MGPRGLSLAAAGFVLLGASVACQDPPGPKSSHRGRASEYRSARLDGELSAAVGKVRTRGFTGTADDWRGFLVPGTSHIQEARMRTGRCSMFVGVGSTALTDLSIRIYDAQGGEVASDPLGGRYAAVQFCPPQAGTYYVITQALTGSGLFHVQQLTGPSGIAVRLEDLFNVESHAEERFPHRP